MKGNSRQKLDQRTFMAQVCECRDKGYLLSPKKIGSGALSKVYLAYATQERVQHNPWLASDLRGKRHSMVQLYETYHNSQCTYLVLELAGHGNLLEHINTVSDHRRCPGLEEEEAHRLFWQLVSAVAHCHSSGVVHRDLKCGNILLDDQGFLKLTDFGFANQSALKNALLSTFCAPWPTRRPRSSRARSTAGSGRICGACVILYAMVTGKLPFKERRPHRLLLLMRRGPAFPPDLSPECQDLIRALLQLRPCARPDLPQVAAHRWMLPAPPALFRSALRAAPDNPAEPREDSERTRPLRQLRRPQQQGTPKSASSPAPPDPGGPPWPRGWLCLCWAGAPEHREGQPPSP